MKPQVCRCGAYTFPHRAGGGRCSSPPNGGIPSIYSQWERAVEVSACVLPYDIYKARVEAELDIKEVG